MKKRTVFCVIAHPDDEAFGPSGTIALLTKTEDVHVVCVTDGASDPKFHPKGGKSLGDIRKEELRASADVLGVSHVHFLGFADGSLNNNSYHDVAARLEELVVRYKPSLLLTYELRGASGHLDHVAVSMITSYVYRNHTEIDAIWYNCVRKDVSDTMTDYFVFFPPGFERDEVDMVVDVTGVFTQKLAAAACHDSQKKDVDRVTKRWLELPKEEWFFVEKRRDSLTIG